MKWVIETDGLTEAEHTKRVTWVERNLLNSSGDIAGAFVSVVVFDEDGNVVRFAGNGKAASEETEEIIKDLIGEPNDT